MRLIKEEYILADFIKKFSPSVTLSGAWCVSIHDGEFSNYLLLWLLLSCSFRHALQRQQNLGGRNKPWQHQHHAPWLPRASVPQFPHLWAWRIPGIPANHGFGVRSPKGVYTARLCRRGGNGEFLLSQASRSHARRRWHGCTYRGLVPERFQCFLIWPCCVIIFLTSLV